MRWIAPPSKDAATTNLETRLWSAADELRANSQFKASEYSAPVLGLIFLRFADARFAARRAELEKAGSGRRGSRVDEPGAYHAAGVLFLPPEARFADLLEYPEGGRKGTALGQAVDDAMRAIERDNPQLSGVLPKTYQVFNARTLKELLKTFSTIPMDLEGDAFGKIYEYFLGEFAMTEGQGGGEFYTPTSIVRLLVEILEPFKGRVLDPACGSGGMFVQSARFVAEHKKSGATELAIHGVEKVDDTGRLCRLNLAVHGLEGDIRHGGEINSYYDDPHKMVGRFDFVLANPPFNVNNVDKDRLRDSVGPGRRYPFGIPNTDNANYLWIQLFYSALNSTGRAGFVMANSASDARSSEMELRRKLIESGAVDVVVSVGPNMFYTVTLPCTLWFFDKGKTGSKRRDQVLFIDARHIYRQIDRAHRDWTEGQLGFLANIVRFYRGEDLDVTYGGDEAREKLVEVFGKKPKYADLAGFCRVVTLKEIEAQGWSLNPGRYVGVVAGDEVSNEDFMAKFEALTEEFDALTAEAHKMERTIAKNAAEILGGIMGNWRVGTLGDILDVKHGFAFLGQYFAESGSHIVLTPGNFREGGGFRAKGDKEKWYTGPVPDEYVLHKGDVLVAMTEQAEGLLGSSAMVPRDGLYLHNQRLGLVRSRGADLGFIYHLFNSREVRQQIRGAATGTKVRHTSPSRIAAVKVAIPPLPEQRRIAGILHAYDELTENCERRIRVLDETARALYREWFVEFRYPGHEKVSMADTALGRIPRGWAVRPLKMVCKLTMGQSPKSEFYNENREGLPFHQGVTDFGVRFPSSRVFCTVGARTAETGDILFSVRAPVGRMNIADKPIALGRGVSAIRHLEDSQAFLWEQLRAQFTREDMIGNGAIFAAVTKSEMEKILLLCPPREIVGAMTERVAPLHAAIANFGARAANLRVTRDLLLPRLLSGQISLEDTA